RTDAGLHKENLIVDVKLRRFFTESHCYSPLVSSTSSSSDAFILGNAGACSFYVREQADNTSTPG
ncbi:MAG: hypothetical protein ACRC1I_10230, partial [Pseudomonas proteolytica]|uniref:hypothetical protein n=1 Tax=Pseudomonas proteolytica TaxID=219574 RepID=UPI003F34574E